MLSPCPYNISLRTSNVVVPCKAGSIVFSVNSFSPANLSGIYPFHGVSSLIYLTHCFSTNAESARNTSSYQADRIFIRLRVTQNYEIYLDIRSGLCRYSQDCTVDEVQCCIQKSLYIASYLLNKEMIVASIAALVLSVGAIKCVGHVFIRFTVVDFRHEVC